MRNKVLIINTHDRIEEQIGQYLTEQGIDNDVKEVFPKTIPHEKIIDFSGDYGLFRTRLSKEVKEAIDEIPVENYDYVFTNKGFTMTDNDYRGIGIIREIKSKNPHIKTMVFADLLSYAETPYRHEFLWKEKINFVKASTLAQPWDKKNIAIEIASDISRYVKMQEK